VPFTGFRRSIHRISTRAAFRICLVAAVVVLASRAGVAQITDAALFRVFLNDGRVLTSYGEWARLDARVVFSMPTRRGAPSAELHLVSIAAAEVDWERTERYANAVRASAYAATRGEADFGRLSDEVARTLNEVAVLPTPAARLARAEQARKALNDWPGAHYGYRAAEVREILGMLDEVIAELRASSGLGRFDLALVAPPALPPDEPLLPEPSESETVEQLFTAASLAETAAERRSLLQTLIGLLDRAVDLLPPAWSQLMRGTAIGRLAAEDRIDQQYGELRTSALAASLRHVGRANVNGLERLRRDVLEKDAELGHHRPAEVASLVSTIDGRLDSARRFRLARDQWELRAPGVKKYRRAVDPSIRTAVRTIPRLEDVRAQAGPPAKSLAPLLDRWRRQGANLGIIAPPAELVPVHALFRSAWEMAEQAFVLRLAAVSSNDVERAQQASSAAAGALMLLTRARADLDAALKPPEVPALP
jgi:hypothetical protein